MGTAGSDVPQQVGWRVATCVAYGASQLPRIAWYVGHGLAVRRLFEVAQQRDGQKAQPSAHTNLPVPDDGMRVLLDFVRLDRDCGQRKAASHAPISSDRHIDLPPTTRDRGNVPARIVGGGLEE